MANVLGGCRDVSQTLVPLLVDEVERNDELGPDERSDGVDDVVDEAPAHFVVFTRWIAELE
jgi:hypothetical protein